MHAPRRPRRAPARCASGGRRRPSAAGRAIGGIPHAHSSAVVIAPARASASRPPRTRRRSARDTARTRTRSPSSAANSRVASPCPVAQIRCRLVGQAARDPLGDARVERARALAAAVHEQHAAAARAESPTRARAAARRGAARRRLDRVAGVDSARARAPPEAARRASGKAEVDLARPAAERARREPGIAVCLLHARSGCRAAPRTRARRRPRSRRCRRRAAAAARATSAPMRAPCADARRAASPVLPRRRAIERVQVEQHVRELGRRQHVALDAAPRADEERLDARVEPHERARDGEPGIEVPAGAAAGERARVAAGRAQLTPARRERIRRAAADHALLARCRCSRACRS